MPHPHHKIGVAKANITYRDSSLSTLGFFAAGHQTKAGKASPADMAAYRDFELWARSFVIEEYDAHGEAQDITIIVIADIWACSKRLKERVRLKIAQDSAFKANVNLYNGKNIIISGTHHHAGPGGYFEEGSMFNAAVKGTDDARAANLETIAEGIYQSIKNAYQSRKRGKIFLNQGDLNIGWNRSQQAYDNNEDAKAFMNIDPSMLLLKFCHSLADGTEKAIGLLNWFAIHPTDRGKGQSGPNNCIHGDNKGYAALQLEKEEGEGFVAAFANSNCGDVNGEMIYHNGKPINKIKDKALVEKLRFAAMIKNGEAQKEKAKSLLNGKDANGKSIPTIELTGPIDFVLKEFDFSNIKNDSENWQTAIPTIGFSMLTGSTEGGVSALASCLFDLDEGITHEDISDARRNLRHKISTAALTTIDTILYITSKISAGKVPNCANCQFPFCNENQPNCKFPNYDVIKAGLLKSDLLIRNITRANLKPVHELANKEIKAHLPKPIALVLGDAAPTLLEKELPLQIIRIGSLAILGIPAELTTMAGRRLRKALLEFLAPAGITHIALGTYSNYYSQYVSTYEEYQKQNYEGASTLYGPHTLKAYIQCFKELALHFVNMA